MNWTNNNKVILQEQAGYRAAYSTIDHLFDLYSLVQRMLRRNKLFACVVDFKKPMVNTYKYLGLYFSAK